MSMGILTRGREPVPENEAGWLRMFGLAAFVTAFILGIWVASVFGAARVSHSQSRMQKKVLYWQRRARPDDEDPWQW